MISYQFCGNVPNEEILAYYQNNEIDCFIHTSEKEGLPISIAEAESAGIPIIATSAGGTRELIHENGFLIPVDSDPSIIADAIERIVTLTEKEKKVMASRSREHWERCFDAKKNARVFRKLIQSQGNSEIQHLIIITEGYPYTNNEKGFIETELKELVKWYRITIIACVNTKIDTECIQVANENIDYLCDINNRKRIEVIPYYNRWRKIDLFFYTIKYCLDRRTRIERTQIMESHDRRFIRLWESSKYYGKAEKFYKWFKHSGVINEQENDSTVIYTYWNLEPTLGICINRGDFGGVRVITRAHGYDYQDEQWEKSSRKPFATSVDNLVDKIIFVCKDGMESYLKKNKKQRDQKKYCYSYLGTRDSREIGMRFSNKQRDMLKTENAFLIVVSCASLIPLKRVDKIIDALSVVNKRRPDLRIHWTHFGEGLLHMQLEDYAGRVLGRMD